MTKFEKKLLVLRSQLSGPDPDRAYSDALVCLEFAKSHHTGTRKDGVTPEFQHQVEIGLYALTLPVLRWREEVICTIFLHDVREDYGITDAEIMALFPNDPIKGRRVADAVDAMTKTFRGVVRDEAELFKRMAANPIASIAKGCDRIHNLQTMVGVFSVEKMIAYVAEAKALFFPMLKEARKQHAFQRTAYENIKFVLISQIELIEAVIAAEQSK
jgi:(p)ppGpp synthase/HD superfamily hydrolase